MNKSQTISVIAIALFATVLLLGPIAGDADAKCHKKHKGSSNHNGDNGGNGGGNGNGNGNGNGEEDNKNNRADQEISQAQFSEQNSQCISGGITALSCNNIGLQAAATTGNNALGQEE